MKKFTAVFILISLCTLFSCSDVTGDFNYMNELKKTISEKYGTEKIEVHIKNNDELMVSISDHKFDTYSSTEKMQISGEIGIMAQKLRNEKVKIKKGVVIFQDEDNYIVAKTISAQAFPMF